MPHYVTLVRYTHQGISNIKDSPARFDAAKKATEAEGGKVHAWYLTMGQYDAVVISEAPDDDTVAKLALAAAGRGNVRTETVRAFDENEAKRLAAEL